MDKDIKSNDAIRSQVRDSYAQVVRAHDNGQSCGEASSCCGVSADIKSLDSTRLGYSEEDIGNAPRDADLGLGCGNPHAIASLEKGETVLDLGSGAGFDCFLAANQVGDSGHVIGIDMTPDMLTKARGNAQQAGYTNVEFRLGEIENLPVADNLVDVITSNCVINLSPDKPRVFEEAFRVLKPGGRLAISDVVASAELPAAMKEDPYLHSCCVAGASRADELKDMLQAAGFTDIHIQPRDESREFIRDWVPGSNVEEYILSATIEARKPVSPCC
jgi:SAM-dependent methyltransferase